VADKTKQEQELKDKFHLQADGKAHITLHYPINIGGEKVEVIKMRRMKVRDQTKQQKNGGTDAEKEVGMFVDLCELTPDQIEELDMKDYEQLKECISSFLS
jgi:hypothetical protein